MTNRTVVRLVGVYDADGTALGELSYFLRARAGRAHCALCDITHGAVRERAAWRASRSTLPVPFVTYHRDEQPAAVRTAGAGAPPFVAAELVDGEAVLLLSAGDLQRCGGSPERLVEAVGAALGRADPPMMWAE